MYPSRHLHKFGFAEQREYRLCGKENEDSLHILCHCPALSCKRYRFWDHTFLEPEDLAEKRRE